MMRKLELAHITRLIKQTITDRRTQMSQFISMQADDYALETIEIIRDKGRIIKLETEQRELLKNEMMERYFSRCDTLLLPSGIVIATARLHEVEEFDKKRFSQEHPDLYKQYTSIKVRQPLLIK